MRTGLQHPRQEGAVGEHQPIASAAATGSTRRRSPGSRRPCSPSAAGSVCCPPIIRRPTIRRAYWIGDAALAALDEHDEAHHGHHRDQDHQPRPRGSTAASRRCSGTRSGSRSAGPRRCRAKMISDIPLPMPRSVICSPSHMMNAVPVVSVRMNIIRKPQPGLYRRGRTAAPANCANANDWTMAMPDRQVARVLGDLACRPSSPSFCSRSSVGTATVMQLQDDRRRDVGHDARGRRSSGWPAGRPRTGSGCPRHEPCAISNSRCSSCVLTPGVGMNPPTR